MFGISRNHSLIKIFLAMLYSVFPRISRIDRLQACLLRLVFACLDGIRIPVQLYFRTRFDFQFAYTILFTRDASCFSRYFMLFLLIPGPLLANNFLLLIGHRYFRSRGFLHRERNKHEYRFTFFCCTSIICCIFVLQIYFSIFLYKKEFRW